VEAIVEIKIDVSVQIDDENTGIYDSEDKVMLFREQTDMRVQQTVEIPMLLSFYIVDDEDFEIMDIIGVKAWNSVSNKPEVSN